MAWMPAQIHPGRLLEQPLGDRGRQHADSVAFEILEAGQAGGFFACDDLLGVLIVRPQFFCKHGLSKGAWRFQTERTPMLLGICPNGA
jgi:hypothetical protein